MSVSLNSFNQSAARNSGDSRRAAQGATAPSIRTVLLGGQSSASVNPSAKTSSADYISSAVFMRNLKAKLSTAGDDPAQYLRARSMMDAMARGSLKVSDPTQGTTISAWDPTQKTPKATTASAIAKTDWVNFLNAQLQRHDNGSLAKDANGSYVEKTTGANAYFGRVAGKYYYVTWPSETKG